MVPELRERAGGVPVIATAGAVLAALRALGVKRVAVATPYVDFVNEAERAFLEEHGFGVTSLLGLRLGETQAERRFIGRVPPQQVYRLARQADRPDAEAIFISCTNLATLDVIAQLEADCGKPVISSNQACFWACLRVMGIPDSIAGYGKLLLHCTAPIDPRAMTPPAIG
jgi:arylmalonate decarboxylase